MIIIRNMRTNHVENPLGFDQKPVAFSWVADAVNSDAEKVLYTRVQVSENPAMENIVFDTGDRPDLDSLCFRRTMPFSPGHGISGGQP